MKKAPASTVYHTGDPYPIMCVIIQGTKTKSPVLGFGTVRNSVVKGIVQRSLYFTGGWSRSAKSTVGFKSLVK